MSFLAVTDWQKWGKSSGANITIVVRTLVKPGKQTVTRTARRILHLWYKQISANNMQREEEGTLAEGRMMGPQGEI